MHNYIYELRHEPIEEDNRMTEDDFFDNGFIDNIADYVSEIDDYDKALADFVESLKEIADYNPVERSLVFHADAKPVWFKGYYDSFKDEIKDLTIESFCDPVKAYRFKELIDDKFGDYIYDDSYSTIDSFIRDLEPNEKFYVGGILDYHH